MPREFELKFDLATDALSQLKAESPFRSALGGARPKKLTSVYFDDSKRTLQKAGLILRVRRTGRRYLQTIKSSPDGAMVDRSEWEVDVEGPDPDLSAAAGTPLEPLLQKKSVRNGLAPVFSTTVQRLSTLVANEGSVVELSVDVGTVAAGPRSAPLCELELELKTGEVARVFDVARTLNEMAPLRLGVMSKSERGYALLEDQSPGPAKAEEPLLDRTMTAGNAFQVVARSCLRQLALNQGMLGESRDPNILHQARVATRRLRAAISLFKAVLVDDRRDAINAELKWLARLLGGARDLDVFITKFLKPHDEADSVEDVEDLVAEYERQREDAYDRVLDALGSPRFRNLVLDLVAWIEAGPWLASDDQEAVARRTQPIDEYVAGVLAKRRKVIVKGGVNLDEIDDEARHQVRIRAKKLRYASEFLGRLYRRKRRKKHEAFVAALESLQACLGELNDIVKAQQFGADPDRFDNARRGDAAQEGRRAGVGDLGAGSRALLKKASRAHAEFVETKPFWR